MIILLVVDGQSHRVQTFCHVNLLVYFFSFKEQMVIRGAEARLKRLEKHNHKCLVAGIFPCV
jgi:hypothetical protein